ncbi:CCA tRNA nucleotidyltransferase [Wukongibacter baidiensis]|uniref:CCA tRNA nucleotidyltransferase n=1 Tax=Wukongibacter baidiensis TaxID=1723361 RepID=UPI003D7F7081
MKIQIPEKVNRILDVLNNYNYEGYIVGGCVRDSILGREPNDWDICTNCKPERMLEIFDGFKVVPTGLKHGTVTIVIEKEHFEVTTFRIDKDYNDGRRPDKVEFTRDLREDLKRRDFTINAMAYGRREGLIDYYGGMDDISSKKVRCVGEPSQRFSEDYLRMLRAVRFSTQLGYELEPKTFNGIGELSNNIVYISKERIREELNKILLSNEPSKGFRLLLETGLLGHIIPEMVQCINFEQRNPHHDKDVFNHIMSVLDNTKKDLVLRLAALLHDIAKPSCFSIDEEGVGHFYSHHMKGMDMAEEILKGLKYDNQTIDLVKVLVKEHMSKFHELTPRIVKRLINRVGVDNIERLFELQRADIKGSSEPHDFSSIEEVKELYMKIINEKQPLSVKDLEINGRDLMQIGIPQGKEIGIILEKLLEKVLDNPEINKKGLLMDEVKGILLEKGRNEC